MKSRVDRNAPPEILAFPESKTESALKAEWIFRHSRPLAAQQHEFPEVGFVGSA
jgi:hypothetical protein